MKKSLKTRILAFGIVGLLSFGWSGNASLLSAPVKATQSLEELETLKDENKKKIAELQDKILKAQNEYDALTLDENAKLEYQNALNQKITLQNQNIKYVGEQIDKINADIEENSSQIAALEQQIAIKQADIDQSIWLFKQRLRASYMSGNDNLAAIFAGSADFYDMLAKMELVSKVAEHDDKLIADLKVQLEEFEELNAVLSSRKQQLDESMERASDKKSEYSQILSELQSDQEKTFAELEKLGAQKQEIEEDIESKEAAIAEQEEEYENIMANIAAVQERLRQESIAASVSVSKSVAVSVSESISASQSVADSIAAAESSRKAEIEASNNVTQAPPAVTEPPATQAPPATAAPSTPAPVYTQAPVSSSQLAWPIPGYHDRSSDYGYRSFDSSFHKGIDIQGGVLGAQVVAADDGVVVTAINYCTHNYGKNYSCGCGGGYGNYVTIAHSDGVYSTLYAHCQSIVVSAGQTVTKGQLIGYAGTTGYSTGPHLHFEIHKNGNHTDPLSYVYNE